MNLWSSECSSGCESGWTTYLDHYSNSYAVNYAHNYEERGANANENDNQEEDEDLSMVSDASSGPPNQNYVSEPQYYGYASYVQEETKKISKQKKKSKTKETNMQKHQCLDDTASSSVLHFSQDNAVPPEKEHFQGESAPKKRLGFLKSSTKGKSGSLLGRKRQ